MISFRRPTFSCSPRRTFCAAQSMLLGSPESFTNSCSTTCTPSETIASKSQRSSAITEPTISTDLFSTVTGTKQNFYPEEYCIWPTTYAETTSRSILKVILRSSLKRNFIPMFLCRTILTRCARNTFTIFVFLFTRPTAMIFLFQCRSSNQKQKILLLCAFNQELTNWNHPRSHTGPCTTKTRLSCSNEVKHFENIIVAFSNRFFII